jgi:hypothetical protein
VVAMSETDSLPVKREKSHKKSHSPKDSTDAIKVPRKDVPEATATTVNTLKYDRLISKEDTSFSFFHSQSSPF